MGDTRNFESVPITTTKLSEYQYQWYDWYRVLNEWSATVHTQISYT